MGLELDWHTVPDNVLTGLPTPIVSLAVSQTNPVPVQEVTLFGSCS